jgi:hypothetical protein
MTTRIPPRAQALSVEVVGGKLVISIGVDCLKTAIEWAPALVKYNNASDDYEYPTVTDVDTFAHELANALERESEDGTTPVHRMIDAAAVEAIEYGAEGVEIP